MPSFKWLRKKVLRKKKRGSRNKDLLPLLPADRPSILTPSTSSENLVSFDNYGLFQRLPYEIRRSILIEAFGGRTLHMDLEFNHPLVRKSGTQTEISHCDLDSNLIRDTDIRKGWQWFGCVCHRREDGHCGSLFRSLFGTREGELIPKGRPWEDTCWRGIPNPSECGLLRGKDGPSKCFIGIIGWLLACRQAYADGIDVLFATNTFHLKSPDLLEHLQRMVLPQRLRAIPFLEMCWLNKYSRSQLRVLWDDPTTEDSELHALCRMVPQAFPNVLRLDITIICDIRPTGDDFPDITWATRRVRARTLKLSALAMEHSIFGPIERMLRTLGPGREFSITISMCAWEILADKHRVLYGSELKIEWYCSGIEGRFWKVLDPVNELGYWICCGDNQEMRMRYLDCGMGQGAENVRNAEIQEAAQIVEDAQIATDAESAENAQNAA
ncbi:hypothetical protein VE01_04594 [Pseudogymnoascus verrucosus]|uniref:DUF7730 domain-containing protein n=1 Tax=Pseudogymnoascus verrucosus TaxID=342668 RepID=A0A1B8GP97_9PEZI|nr:uncharacterized protein VE01_04594 [Pseudogymnoascus verrucosus]OBT97676.1 hypothetical protein VE01_04594 [Pseudogymnoascus verrucosus]